MDGKFKHISEHPSCNKITIKKIQEELGDGCFYPVDRDGNCFYSSVAILLYPEILGDPEILFSLTPLFERAGICCVVYETYLEEIKRCIAEQREYSELGKMEQMLFIGVMRLATSANIIANEEFFSGFLGDERADSYVKRAVDPMEERAGEIEIVSLSQALGIKLVVIQVSSSGFSIERYGEGREYMILHTPDHFEPYVLKPKEALL